MDEAMVFLFASMKSPKRIPKRPTVVKYPMNRHEPSVASARSVVAMPFVPFVASERSVRSKARSPVRSVLATPRSPGFL